MKGLWSEHFPDKPPSISPNKTRLWSEHFTDKPPSISPTKTRLWSEHFPDKPPSISPTKTNANSSSPVQSSGPTTTPLHISPTKINNDLYKRSLLCPKCNAATCLLLTSNTTKNPNRLFYTCSCKNFFKWADEVNPNQLIDVPICGGCAAGTCRVRRDTTGPNAGRILFTCRVKEGEGACGYSVWQDELERLTSSQSTINATNTGLVEECNNVDKGGADIVTPMPMINNTSKHLQCHEIISPETGQSKFQQDKPNESSRGPRLMESNYTCGGGSNVHCTLEPVVQDPILVNNIESNSLIRSSEGVKSNGKPLFDLKMCRNTLDCIPAVMVNSRDSTTVTWSILEAENYSTPLSSPCHSQNTELFGSALDVPSLSKAITQNVMPKSISNAFVPAGQNLQNVLFNLLETTDVKDHVAMRQAAEATFAALDSLRLGDQDFKNRVNEFIQCASSLSEIEQSMPTNDSYQKLVERCSSERVRLEEISCVHAETVDTFTKKKQRLLEEMRNMEVELDDISRNKEELEGKYLSAHNELEELKKLFERKEEEAGVAKAAYDRARALLRG